MAGRVDGRAKLDIARETLLGLVGDLPADARVSVRAYGHRRRDDCSDIELVSALAPRDPGVVERALTPLRPVGMTPMAAALEETTRDIAGTRWHKTGDHTMLRMAPARLSLAAGTGGPGAAEVAAEFDWVEGQPRPVQPRP